MCFSLSVVRVYLSALCSGCVLLPSHITVCAQVCSSCFYFESVLPLHLSDITLPAIFDCTPEFSGHCLPPLPVLSCIPQSSLCSWAFFCLLSLDLSFKHLQRYWTTLAFKNHGYLLSSTGCLWKMLFYSMMKNVRAVVEINLFITTHLSLLFIFFISIAQLFVLFSFYLSSSGQSSIGHQETVHSFLNSVIRSDMVQL